MIRPTLNLFVQEQKRNERVSAFVNPQFSNAAGDRSIEFLQELLKQPCSGNGRKIFNGIIERKSPGFRKKGRVNVYSKAIVQACFYGAIMKERTVNPVLTILKSHGI